MKQLEQGGEGEFPPRMSVDHQTLEKMRNNTSSLLRGWCHASLWKIVHQVSY